MALTDRMDVVVAHRPDDGPGWAGGRAVQVVPLLREPLDVAVPLDHPLARAHRGPARRPARPAVDRGARGVPRRDGAGRGGRRSGAAPRIVHRVNDFHVVEALVEAGHGVSLLPRYTFGGGTRVRLVPLAGCGRDGGSTRCCDATAPSGWWSAGSSTSSVRSPLDIDTA